MNVKSLIPSLPLIAKVAVSMVVVFAVLNFAPVSWDVKKFFRA